MLYTVSDLLALTLFSVFKLDEDCFSCFNRCQDIRAYSIFQMGDKLEGFILIDNEFEEQVSSLKLIEENLNRTTKLGNTVISEASEESSLNGHSKIESVTSSFYVDRYKEVEDRNNLN